MAAGWCLAGCGCAGNNHGRTRRHHPSAAALANHGRAERAAIGRGAGILETEKADRRHRRQSRRPYRDAVEGRLRRGGKGLCRQEAADHGDAPPRPAAAPSPAMSPCCRKSSRRRAEGSGRESPDPCTIVAMDSGPAPLPLAGGGRFVRPTWPPRSPHLASPHEHPPARFRRPRTRSRVEDCRLAAADQTVVRAGQCRHRQRGRMRRRSMSPTTPR